MDQLLEIRGHVDAHGLRCAIVGDHVAIGVVWTTRTIAGEERRRETIERVKALEAGGGVIGCACGGSAQAG